ncbi:BCD family chlorophyll transporter-like MFS transporter [Rhodoligotrophos appendicifer]|uniref:BCD family MFS transporter n=1 Tax=Rhodoligotrophos appendicifer TaxID=987056 RepID=UPI0011856AF2|nr:BCD family MFS transporter [Rhodoligotrophos appendicifer]
MGATPLGWIGILRLALVQASLGSIVVLTTSTLNRIMVVELGLAATIPGALVGLHYGVQIARPLWGHGSDRGGRRTPWIIGGVALLAFAGTGAAVATAVMAEHFALGLTLAILDFMLIGFGVGAAGTSLLALLASKVAPERRPAAATVVWVMMIFGIAVTAIVSGRFLDPFSMERLIEVTAVTGLLALAVTWIAVAGVEGPAPEAAVPKEGRAPPAATFRESLEDAWADPAARLFTIFVFVSMLGYSMQDLILEPFAGLVFAMTPGQTTTLSGIQNGGVFMGMGLVGIAGSLLAKSHPWLLRAFTVGGCVASGLALAMLAASAWAPSSWPLTANVFALGFANGVFAVAAIASMMALAGAAGPSRVGLRMGLWGAAQAIAFGLGGFAGTVAVDMVRVLGGAIPLAYGSVFLLEGAIFLAAAGLAHRIGIMNATTPSPGHKRIAYAATIEGAQ